LYQSLVSKGFIKIPNSYDEIYGLAIFSNSKDGFPYGADGLIENSLRFLVLDDVNDKYFWFDSIKRSKYLVYLKTIHVKSSVKISIRYMEDYPSIRELEINMDGGITDITLSKVERIHIFYDPNNLNRDMQSTDGSPNQLGEVDRVLRIA